NAVGGIQGTRIAKAQRTHFLTDLEVFGSFVIVRLRREADTAGDGDYRFFTIPSLEVDILTGTTVPRRGKGRTRLGIIPRGSSIIAFIFTGQIIYVSTLGGHGHDPVGIT